MSRRCEEEEETRRGEKREEAKMYRLLFRYDAQGHNTNMLVRAYIMNKTTCKHTGQTLKDTLQNKKAPNRRSTLHIFLDVRIPFDRK